MGYFSNIGCLRGDWTRAVLVPIYNKCYQNDLKAYRPIALLSHFRKAKQAGISIQLIEGFTNGNWQLIFQRKPGTGIALVRYTSIAQNIEFMAMLDPKSMTNLVPRQYPVKKVKWTAQNLPKMIAITLKPIMQTTKGDSKQIESVFERKTG